MAISGVSTDYSFRKKDIHIFQNVNVNKVANINPSFGSISNFCTGIQKLIQRYTIALLTNVNSQEAYPEFGTELLIKLSNTNLTIDKSRLQHIFNFANYDVVRSFRDYQANNPGAPEDEQLDTAELEDIIVSNQTVSLSIKIYPRQKTPVTFIIPLPKS